MLRSWRVTINRFNGFGLPISVIQWRNATASPGQGSGFFGLAFHRSKDGELYARPFFFFLISHPCINQGSFAFLVRVMYPHVKGMKRRKPA